MRNGVKQGCVPSPLHFNIVLDTAMSKANNTQRGIRWTLTDRLKDLDYVDDTWVYQKVPRLPSTDRKQMALVEYLRYD